MATDKFLQLAPGSVKFHGRVGKALRLTVDNRLNKVDYDKLVKSFRDHEDTDNFWRGEFWGKIVRSAIRVWAACPNELLLEKIRKTVRDLCAAAEPSGRLSTYPKEKEFTCWDTWGRKYALLGLARYYRTVEPDPEVLETIRRAVKDFLTHYRPGQRPGDGLPHNGMAANSILGAIEIAGRLTGEQSFFEFAEAVVTAGCADNMDLFAQSRAGVLPAALCNGKAYEMTSCFEGLLELYRDHGDPKLLETAVNYFRDICKYELFITGAGGLRDHWGEYWDYGAAKQLSSAENFALGETCVTTTVMRFAFQLLRLTGDSSIADQIELSLLNGILGAMKHDGSWWMHRNVTPLAGAGWKRPAGDQIKGYGEDCCLAQGPEGLGVGGVFAFLRGENALMVNYFEAAEVTAEFSGVPMKLSIHGNYPDDGKIEIEVEPARPVRFALLLRIPGWCRMAELDGRPVASGRYAELDREWKSGDRITLDLPMPVRLIPAPDGSTRFAVMRGPMLLVQDSRLGKVDEPIEIPAGEEPERIDAMGITAAYRWSNGVTLCDYASAGNRFEESNMLCVWLPRK